MVANDSLELDRHRYYRLSPRILFRIRGGGKREVQSRFVALVEYASFLPIITASLMGGAFWLITFVGGFFFPTTFANWLPIFIAVPPTMLAAVPAGFHINKAWAQLGARAARGETNAKPIRRSRISLSLTAGRYSEYWSFSSSLQFYGYRERLSGRDSRTSRLRS